ncbi:FtsH protease activity modulator HflK [Sphingobium lignivorans]|uniref:Protein HflK n=1 Tax=Sphingobium lignivorans TaxID=2735886 RepID=A0ABR6NKZ2_9SPHN|nr:FtsH protease activity modulator HflK [Sphingobium lignivorans]MBB5987955.1 membrane protease subunit HflK [Sphingobium lignivorans]
MDTDMTQRPGQPSAMSEGGPWGSRDEEPSTGRGGDGPRNPWTPPPRGEPGGRGTRGPSAIDELLRRARDSFGGGLPPRAGGRAIWPYLLGGVALIWIATTSVHRIGPQERGIVSMLGSYSRTLGPGINWTLPAPLESVAVIDVEEIRTIDLGSAGEESEKLVLTGDQNIINLGYSVRWNIRDPQQYAFQIADPDATIAAVAESAMRAVVANVSLTDALGAGRNAIESQVQERMQGILDTYGAGVRIQGVAIKQADPPDAVNDAFKEVSAAQQAAETYLNQARAYSQQLAAQSQGEAAAFDKVYEEYRLAPDVTRRRMYYETMEKVLSGVNKTIIEANGVTPYLPLPAIRPRTPTASVEASPQPQQGGGQ